MRKATTISFVILFLAFYGQAFGQKYELQNQYLLRLHNINSNLAKLLDDILLNCKDIPQCIKNEDIEQSKKIIRRLDKLEQRYDALNTQYADLKKEVEMNYKGEWPIHFSSQWTDELEKHSRHLKYINKQMGKLDRECQKLLQELKKGY